MIALPFMFLQQLCLTTETQPRIGLGSDRLVTVALGEKTSSHRQEQVALW